MASESPYSVGDSDITIEDPEDYNRIRRLKELNDIREDMRKTIERAVEGEHIGEFNPDTALTAVRTALESYLRELEWVMRRWSQNLDEDADVPDFWAEYPLGTMELPDGTTVEFRGVKSILEAPKRFTYEHDEQVETQFGSEKRQIEGSVQIDREILLNALRAAYGWVESVGLDLRVEDGGLPIEERFGATVGDGEETGGVNRVDTTGAPQL